MLEDAMPLPALKKFGAAQCRAKSKRSGRRCNNPAAYGCKTCRMHGARKPETIPKGNNHPRYKNGKETLEARAARKAAIERLHYLCDLGNKVGLFFGGVKLRGRRPKIIKSHNHGSDRMLTKQIFSCACLATNVSGTG